MLGRVARVRDDELGGTEALRLEGNKVGSRRLPALVALVNADQPADGARDQDDEQERVA